MVGSGYTASAQITLRSNAAQVLAQVGRSLGLLDRRIIATERNLMGLIGRFDRLRGAEASMRNLVGAAGNLRDTFRDVSQAGRGMTRGVDASTASLDRNIAAANRAATAAQRAATAFRALGSVPGAATLALPTSRGPRGGYSARGDRLGELAGLSVVEQAGRRTLGRVVRDAGALQEADTITRLSTSRMTPENGMDGAAYLEAARRRAIETTRLVPGTTITGNLGAVNELRTALMAQNAVRFLPEFQEVATALARMSDADPAAVAGSLGRTLSLRGAFNNQLTGALDPERGVRELNAAGRMLFAYRNDAGGVNNRELEMFQRYARVAGERMDPEDYYGGWTAGLIQNMRGARAGTALNAFTRQMVNGIMPKEQAAFLQQHGFIARNARSARVPESEIRNLLARGEIDDDLATRLRSGAAARFNKRDIINSDLAALRPSLYFDWALKTLRERGIVSPDDRDAWANRAGSTSVGRSLWAYGLAPEAQRPDRAAVAGVNMDAIQLYNREGFNASRGAMEAGLTNATTSLGSAATGDVVRLMNDLARGLNDIGDWARANPDSARTVINIGAALTALAGAGVAFAAGSMALSGLAGLTAALGTGAGLAGVVGSAAFTLAVGPAGLAALALGITGLALTMEGKDWKALFDGLVTGLSGTMKAIRDQVGLGPKGAAGAGAPLPPGLMPAPGTGIPGVTPPSTGLPSFRPLDRRSDLPSDFNFANFSLPSSGGGGGTPFVINMDGRRVAEGIIPHVSRAMLGPAQAAARTDGNRALRWV